MQSLMPDRDYLGSPDKRLFLFDDQCRNALTEFKVPSVSVAIVSNNQIIYAKGFDASSGQNNASAMMSYAASFLSSSNSNKATDVDTIYSLGTAGEAILGIAIATLVTDGTVQVK
jgi:hypothetical protein